jgi:hypothetical protein
MILCLPPPFCLYSQGTALRRACIVRCEEIQGDLRQSLVRSSHKVRFLQECVKHKIVRLIYVGTRKNISDMMTMQSNGQQLKAHRDFTLGYVDEVIADNTFAGTALRLRRRRVREISV